MKYLNISKLAVLFFAVFAFGSCQEEEGAELPSVQDIKDLLETTNNLGRFASNGIDVNGGEAAFDYYYDAFMFGLAHTENYADAYHSLAGWRENIDMAPSNQEFNNINQKAEFWLRDGNNNETAHYPLSVSYNNTSTTYQMSAYVNAECINRYGFSVRYVFYPFD